MRRAALIVMLTCMPPRTSCFLSHSTCPCSHSKTTCWASSSNIKGASRASEIMKIIKARYGKEDDWNKTRNYLYQANERLTMEQVNQVLEFLDERKCDAFALLSWLIIHATVLTPLVCSCSFCAFVGQEHSHILSSHPEEKCHDTITAHDSVSTTTISRWSL